MGRVVVLGGGRQGRVVAADLGLEGHEVKVVDVDPRGPWPSKVEAWKSDIANWSRWPAELDGKQRPELVICALPAALGVPAVKHALEASLSVVDLAFSEADWSALGELAAKHSASYTPDCGLAPGISNLLVGRALAKHPEMESLEIYVGGVAADKARPFGYVVTWAPTDLYEEYVRPARIRRQGQEVLAPALSEVEPLEVEGIGTFEAFLTDGLRSLLKLEGPQEMVEKTLRWPGHVEAIKPLLGSSEGFVKRIQADCSQGDDLVVLLVRARSRDWSEQAQLIARPSGGLSAMARTTALTCASFASLYLSRGGWGLGLQAPEQIGRDPEACDFILRRLEARGLELSPKRPFS